MRLSIIIPAFNASRYLAQTLDSVIAQTITDWEMIVVNDGSQDATGEIAQRYAERDRRVRVLDRPNGGLAAARNTGFAATDTTSKYICYLDADDMLEPDALSRLSSVLEGNPNAVAAYGLSCKVDAAGRLVDGGELENQFRNRLRIEGTQLQPCPTDTPTSLASLLYFNWVHTAGTLLLRREIQEAVGPFDENMGGCADWDMWIRVARHGDLAFLDRVVLRYRTHAANMSKSRDLMARDELYLRCKLLNWPGDTQEIRRLIEWGYRHRSLQICRFRLEWARDSFRKGAILPMIKHLLDAGKNYRLYAVGPRYKNREPSL